MRQRVTNTWSIDIPDGFSRRIEDGSLVFWATARTIWLGNWERAANETVADTLAWIRADVSPMARWSDVEETEGVTYFSYLVWERDEAEEPRWAHHGYAIAADTFLQCVIYYDVALDEEWAKSTFRSIRRRSDEEPSPAK